MKVSYKENVITIDTGVKAKGLQAVGERYYVLRDEKNNDVASISLCASCDSAANYLQDFMLSPNTICCNVELDNGNLALKVVSDECVASNLKEQLVIAVTKAGDVYDKIAATLDSMIEQRAQVEASSFEGFDAQEA